MLAVGLGTAAVAGYVAFVWRRLSGRRIRFGARLVHRGLTGRKPKR